VKGLIDSLRMKVKQLGVDVILVEQGGIQCGSFILSFQFCTHCVQN
jgi:hypothetical protein